MHYYYIIANCLISIDINYLRFAKDGQDVNYKARVWDVSQNVDFGSFNALPGICSCLTPDGIPYLTCRGGPISMCLHFHKIF